MTAYPVVQAFHNPGSTSLSRLGLAGQDSSAFWFLAFAFTLPSFWNALLLFHSLHQPTSSFNVQCTSTRESGVEYEMTTEEKWESIEDKMSWDWPWWRHTEVFFAGFPSLVVSGFAQLCFDNNSTELWVGHFFSNLRRGEKGKELCPFCPLRNSHERSGLPGGRSSPSFDSGSALITAQHFTSVTWKV